MSMNSPNRLTRRQSQRPSLSRLVQSHESRQRESWLILNVRQNFHQKVIERSPNPSMPHAKVLSHNQRHSSAASVVRKKVSASLTTPEVSWSRKVFADLSRKPS